MTAKDILVLREEVRRQRPLIHCITNPISIRRCADALLAVGARPMMAEHPMEVREITDSAGALLLNLGNITDVRITSMGVSLKAAKEKGIPTVLDVVGVACSTLRRKLAWELIQKGEELVIKGNYSEINALYNKDYQASGVDAEASLDIGEVTHAAVSLAKQHGVMVLASGKTDLVTDGERLFEIKNGTPSLSSITGTGCMLGALCAAYLSVRHDLEAPAAAAAFLGICGEKAETPEGSGSFEVYLMNHLSCLTPGEIENRLKWEEKAIEGI